MFDTQRKNVALFYMALALLKKGETKLLMKVNKIVGYQVHNPAVNPVLSLSGAIQQEKVDIEAAKKAGIIPADEYNARLRFCDSVENAITELVEVAREVTENA